MVKEFKTYDLFIFLKSEVEWLDRRSEKHLKLKETCRYTRFFTSDDAGEYQPDDPAIPHTLQYPAPYTGATIVDIRNGDGKQRSLAYNIIQGRGKKKQMYKKAYHLELRFRSNNLLLKSLNTELRRDENVLRFSLVRTAFDTEPDYVDTVKKLLKK
jgi:ribosomal protein S6